MTLDGPAVREQQPPSRRVSPAATHPDTPPPETIRTRRLALTPMSPQLVRAILDEDWAGAELLLGTPFPMEWRGDGWQWLSSQAERSERDHRHIWGTRLASPADVGTDPDHAPILAEVGFHGPPDPEGWVEIGFRVVAAHRRRGLAEEAASALLAWAAERGATGVRASASADNIASIGLLNKLAFTSAGAYQHHALGPQLIFQRTTRPLP